MKTHLHAAFATALAAGALIAPHAAIAADTEFGDLQQPGGVCQPAREYPDVRVRHIELDNIGAANAYIICAPNVHYSGGSTQAIFLPFYNSGATARTVKCTLQNNYLGSGISVTTVVKETVVQPGGYNSVEFFDHQSPSEDLDMPGIQCILPPLVSVGYIFVEYTENDADT